MDHPLLMLELAIETKPVQQFNPHPIFIEKPSIRPINLSTPQLNGPQTMPINLVTVHKILKFRISLIPGLAAPEPRGRKLHLHPLPSPWEVSDKIWQLPRNYGVKTVHQYDRHDQGRGCQHFQSDEAAGPLRTYLPFYQRVFLRSCQYFLI